MVLADVNAAKTVPSVSIAKSVGNVRKTVGCLVVSIATSVRIVRRVASVTRIATQIYHHIWMKYGPNGGTTAKRDSLRYLDCGCKK